MSRRRIPRGQSIVEFALLLPVFLVILGGALDLGRLFHAYVAIENAAKEGALYGASDPRCSDTKDGCVAPNTVRWRVENEAVGVPALTHTVTCLAGNGGDGDLIDVNQCERGDRYRVSVESRFDFVTPILAPILGDHLDLRSAATSRVMSDAFDPDATAIPIPTPTPSPTPTPTATPAPDPTSTPPPGPTPTPAACGVPNLDGVRRNSALSAWSRAGFSGSVTDRPGAPTGNYIIRYQSLAAGTNQPCTSGVEVDD